MVIAVRAASQGFRRPLWSAMAPSGALSSATSRAEIAVALPQSRVPVVSSGATPRVK